MIVHTGSLVVKDGKIIGEIDRGNIALRVVTPRVYKQDVIINLANTGVQVISRNVGFDLLFINDCACDNLQTWENDFRVGLLIVDDPLDYTYSNQCHKDVMQMFRARVDNGVYTLQSKEWVSGIVVEKADILMTGEDKSGFIVSEIGGIKNSKFFERGICFKTESSNPYLFSADRISNVTFGSPDHPIMPNDISGKKFRIGDIKTRNARCGKWTIHARGNIGLELSKSARKNLTVINY